MHAIYQLLVQLERTCCGGSRRLSLAARDLLGPLGSPLFAFAGGAPGPGPGMYAACTASMARITQLIVFLRTVSCSGGACQHDGVTPSA